MTRTATPTDDATRTLMVELEAMLHHSVQRIGRTVKNLQQELGGFPSKLPGSGDPGGGKGGGPSVYIDDPVDPVTSHHVDDDGEPFEITTTAAQVPITGPELVALGFHGLDNARIVWDELLDHAWQAVRELGTASCIAQGAALDVDHPPAVWRQVVLALAYLRRVQQAAADEQSMPSGVYERLVLAELHVERIHQITQRWGYTPGRPHVPKARAELLAIDLTEMWCTSHLRVGVKRDRDRGELCQWCRKFQALEGFIPPVKLVRLHVDNGRVYDHEVEPFRQAHRRRIAKKR